MQLDTGHPICSLCKRELTFSFESGPGTKLCEGCRSLVQTAFHGVEPQAVAASAGAQQSRTATTYVQSDNSTAGLVETSSPAFFEDLSTFGGAPEQNQQAAFSDLDGGLYEMPFEEDESSAVLDFEMDSLDACEVESIEHHDENFVATAPANESTRAEWSELHLSLSDDGNRNAPSSISTVPCLDQQAQHVPDEAPDDNQSISAVAVADPWEEPLPAWEYSRSEWPVLRGQPRTRSFARFKVPFALLMIFAVGAGLYYFVYPKISRKQPLPTDSAALGRAPEPRDPTPKPADPTAQSQAPSTPSEAAASEAAPPTPTAPRDAAVASVVRNDQGRFTLQAAAFPTQAGADELAGKLKAAGLPSYVVSVDLARRGRWFRVRVGRFDTSEEAQKFAGEAQLRAKVAGTSVQLITLQYEQP